MWGESIKTEENEGKMEWDLCLRQIAVQLCSLQASQSEDNLHSVRGLLGTEEDDGVRLKGPRAQSLLWNYDSK